MAPLRVESMAPAAVVNDSSQGDDQAEVAAQAMVAIQVEVVDPHQDNNLAEVDKHAEIVECSTVINFQYKNCVIMWISFHVYAYSFSFHSVKGSRNLNLICKNFKDIILVAHGKCFLPAVVSVKIKFTIILVFEIFLSAYFSFKHILNNGIQLLVIFPFLLFLV